MDGILVDTWRSGCLSKDGVRVRLAKRQDSPWTDGPFTESKEVIGALADLGERTLRKAV